MQNEEKEEAEREEAQKLRNHDLVLFNVKKYRRLFQASENQEKEEREKIKRLYEFEKMLMMLKKIYYVEIPSYINLQEIEPYHGFTSPISRDRKVERTISVMIDREPIESWVNLFNSSEPFLFTSYVRNEFSPIYWIATDFLRGFEEIKVEAIPFAQTVDKTSPVDAGPVYRKECVAGFIKNFTTILKDMEVHHAINVFKKIFNEFKDLDIFQESPEFFSGLYGPDGVALIDFYDWVRSKNVEKREALSAIFGNQEFNTLEDTSFLKKFIMALPGIPSIMDGEMPGTIYTKEIAQYFEIHSPTAVSAGSA